MSAWVVAGQPGGPPLVALHTWTKERDQYDRLGAALGDRAVYSSLPPSPLDGPPPRRVDQWVDHHERVLRAMPVEAPFRIVGWSFGGVLAVELARRLRANGEGVEWVGLIDSIRPRLKPLSARDYMWVHLGESLHITDERARVAYLWLHTKVLLHRSITGVAPWLMPRSARRASPPKPTDPLTVAIHTAYLNYRGDDVPFPVSLYVTDESVARTDQSALRWAGHLAAGFELVEIPGTHETVFDDAHVTALAAALRRSLDLTTR